MKHLIEWDTLEMRVDGEKLASMGKAAVGLPPPLESIDFHFFNGLLRIEGTIRKFFLIPFTAEIAEIKPEGTRVRVPLHSMSAAGFPLPKLLLNLVRSRLPQELVTFEEPATFIVALDRFLPKFVSIDIQSIWIVEGGLVVTLGRGGADLPPEVINESDGIRLA